MPLNPNALISLAEAKSHLNIPVADTSQDTRVEDFIDAASQHIETATQRIIYQKTHTHYFDGKNQSRILLREYPASKPTSVNVDYCWTFGPDTEIASTMFDQDNDIFVIHKNVFPLGNRNVKITYVAGYSPIPDDLKQACKMLVELFYSSRNDKRLGVESKSKAGETLSFEMKELPVALSNLIIPYSREFYLKSKGIIINGSTK